MLRFAVLSPVARAGGVRAGAERCPQPTARELARSTTVPAARGIVRAWSREIRAVSLPSESSGPDA